MEAPFSKPFSFFTKVFLLSLLLLSLLFLNPTQAFSFGTEDHVHIAYQAIRLLANQSAGEELNKYQSKVIQGAWEADYYNYNEILRIWVLEPGVAAKDHFWDADIPGSHYPGPFFSAPEKAQIYWDLAVQAYKEENLDDAYLFLGYASHFLADMGSPAHAHNDDHFFTGEDCFEGIYLGGTGVAFNYFAEDAPGIAPDRTLYALMYNLNQRAQWFPSVSIISGVGDAGYEGNDKDENGAHHPEWHPGWPSYTAQEIWFDDPGNLKKEKMASILIPLSFSYMAGLYQTFFESLNPSITCLSYIPVLKKTNFFGSGMVKGYPITQWDWDMNYDGQNFHRDPSSTGPSFPYQFKTMGSRTIALRAWNENGDHAIITRTIEVTQYPINVSAPHGQESLDRTFSTPSPDPPSLISKYEWDFGDGSGFQEGQQEVSHTYPSANSYTVTLRLNLDDSSQLTSTRAVSVGGVHGFRYIGGQTIYSNETWTQDWTYVVMGNVAIAPGGSLTIETGTKVYLYGGVSLSISGTLKATGATFTWADGANEWKGIGFWGSGANNSRLDGCVIEHASGHPNLSGIIGVGYDCAPTITGCTISNGKGNGIGIYSGSDAYNYPSRPLITNNTITGCAYGIYSVNWSTPTVTGNTIKNNGYGSFVYITGTHLFSGNTYLGNTIDEYVSGYLSNSVTWNDAATYQVRDLYIEQSGSLTITSGRKVTFDAGGYLTVNGTLKATGVTFTWADGANEWKGIGFWGSGANNSRLDGCVIEHASGHPNLSGPKMSDLLLAYYDKVI
ncbi:MAG: PKD domain-containing protein [Deltaproteobacteria bacterium]|nr:PKD domain-containing protein [Deltaproteobacteria bacterium]